MQRYIIELYLALADGEKTEKPKDCENDNKRKEISENKNGEQQYNRKENNIL